MSEHLTRSRSARAPRLPAAIDRVIRVAQDKKAGDIVVLDLRRSAAFTDYFVICSAQNTRQVQAIVDAIEERLRQTRVKPTLIEGYDRAEWVLLDFFDFVVHVFTRDARVFYALDRLWGSADRIAVPDVD